MARYYATFDGTDNDIMSSSYLHEKVLFDTDKGPGIRSGLLDSRSALSADVYGELDSINQAGGRGIYFPPDQFTTSNAALYTASVYTSSVPGIVIPPQSIATAFRVYDYATRPTSSITSSQTTLVVPTVPLDSASFSSNLYFSASKAVELAFNLGYSTPGTAGVYATLGNTPSRTLFSAFHDPDVTLVAWDNFTPGTPVLNNSSHTLITANCGGNPELGEQLNIQKVRLTYGREFLNDFNSAEDARVQLQVSWSFPIIRGAPFNDTIPGTPQGLINTTINVSGSFAPSAPPSNGTYYYETGSNLLTLFTIFPDAGREGTPIDYVVQMTASFFDSKIVQSRGPFAYQTIFDSYACV